jgi:hypothetical protein
MGVDLGGPEVGAACRILLALVQRRGGQWIWPYIDNVIRQNELLSADEACDTTEYILE